jgi:hypothetical protein
VIPKSCISCCKREICKIWVGTWNVKYKLLFVFMFLQITSLIIESLTWFSMIILILLETKVYIRQFRWLVRFGVIYVLVGDIVMLDLLLSVKEYYSSRFVFNFSVHCIFTFRLMIMHSIFILSYYFNFVSFNK